MSVAQGVGFGSTGAATRDGRDAKATGRERPGASAFSEIVGKGGGKPTKTHAAGPSTQPHADKPAAADPTRSAADADKPASADQAADVNSAPERPIPSDPEMASPAATTDKPSQPLQDTVGMPLPDVLKVDPQAPAAARTDASKAAAPTPELAVEPEPIDVKPATPAPHAAKTDPLTPLAKVPQPPVQAGEIPHPVHGDTDPPGKPDPREQTKSNGKPTVAKDEDAESSPADGSLTLPEAAPVAGPAFPTPATPTRTKPDKGEPATRQDEVTVEPQTSKTVDDTADQNASTMTNTRAGDADGRTLPAEPAKATVPPAATAPAPKTMAAGAPTVQPPPLLTATPSVRAEPAAPRAAETARPSPVATSFRAELTVAAANYAIFPAKATADGLQQAGLAVDPATLEPPNSETTSARVTIVAPRNLQSAHYGVATQVLAAAASLPLRAADPAPSALSAGGAAVAAGAQVATEAEERPIAGRSADLDKSPPARQAAVSDAPAAARVSAPAGAATVAMPVPASPAASVVVAAIGSEASWRPATVALPQQLAGVLGAAEPKTLSIQLHPAELGVVTATLKLSGDTLEVELAPQTEEAHRRLASDSADIAKALRALGFDVDRVSVIQPQGSATVTGKADDASMAAAPQAREQQTAGGGTNGSGGRASGRETERNGNDGLVAPRPSGQASADRGGGGLYI